MPAERGQDQRGAAYAGAFEAVFAILIAIGLGYWADSSFGTAPRYLLVGAVLGFAAFVLRLVRMRSLLETGSNADEPDAGGPPSEGSS